MAIKAMKVLMASLVITVLFTISVLTTARMMKPILTEHKHLQDSYYCGINPDRVTSHPNLIALPDSHLYELVHVQAFIRHGDRMFWGGHLEHGWCWPGQQNTDYKCSLTHTSIPGHSSETSPTRTPLLFRKQYIEGRNDYKGNCHIGQLTVKGHRQERINGALFSKAYVGPGRLLSAGLDPRQNLFRSDDSPRTLLSAESFVQGMFPRANDADNNTRIIDLWTMDKQEENMFSNSFVCPQWNDHVQEAMESAEFKLKDSASRPLYEEVAQVFGVDVNKLEDERAQDCMMVSACRGSPMPSGITRSLLDQVEQHQAWRFYYPIQYPNLHTGMRLAGGPLLREILQRMIAAQSQSGSDLPKFVLTSGHDTGPIMILLSALAYKDKRWVPYASFIAIELYRSKSSPQDYFVRVLFNHEVIDIPGGNKATQLCAFKVFQTYIEPMLPSPNECPHAFDSFTYST